MPTIKIVEKMRPEIMAAPPKPAEQRRRCPRHTERSQRNCEPASTRFDGTQPVRKCSEQFSTIDVVAAHALLGGANRSEHPDAVRTEVDLDTLASTEFGKRFRLEWIECSDRRVSQLIHTRQIVG